MRRRLHIRPKRIELKNALRKLDEMAVEVLSLIAHQVGPHSAIDPEHARLETAIADLRVAIRG